VKCVKKIRKTAGDWADNLSNLWAKGEEAADGAINEVKEKASRAANKAKESYTS